MDISTTGLRLALWVVGRRTLESGFVITDSVFFSPLCLRNWFTMGADLTQLMVPLHALRIFIDRNCTPELADQAAAAPTAIRSAAPRHARWQIVRGSAPAVQSRTDTGFGPVAQYRGGSTQPVGRRGLSGQPYR